MRRLFLFLAIGATAMLSACADGDRPEQERPPVAVVAERVVLLPEQVTVEAIGSAQATRSAQIFAETAGRVTAVLFNAGDYVEKGDPLVRIDDRRERLAVSLAEVAVEEAEQLLGRYRRIEDTGAISASQIEAGASALSSARIELDQARVELADRTVRAPFPGHVGLTEVNVGDRVNDTTQITQIDDRGTLFVDFSAPEEVFGRLQAGETVDLVPYSDPDRTIEARIRAVDSTVAPGERTFTVRTEIPNKGDRLRPGMSFRIQFSSSGQDLPAVPEEAIIWGGEGAYLWTVENGKARRVPLTIAQRRNGRSLVQAKLEADDLIIVEGVQKVRQGQAVNLLDPAVPPPADVRMDSDGASRGRAVRADG
ncbi:efflux RND transporter periplasmic adaptor subunit [Pacificimonas flava]|uniref:Co/Zn/Cd efflux system membrane fusion protein n=1 Tax=Pacificimonas flava TaxID=1234595 RepID=M2TJ86_9SPHN|nr:efflux RND transporter periplasmic adaptor subunit [Pacificimonas flava]EMD81706.1 Co/Zn/Cd efflux system membrane fusion protein [Pacificimonas flava]MBB5281710.1 RND family efflux transporter MFP subunit [Pacificimonas flava]